MKVKNYLRILILFIISVQTPCIFAQLKYSTVPLVNKEITDSVYLESYFEVDTNSHGDTLLTSTRTLNVFFANKISNYLSEASDISFSRGYAVLDNSDGRLFLGGTFKTNKSKEEFNRFIGTAGVKVDIKNNVAAIFNGEDSSSDIGVNLKGTLVGRGIIYFDGDTSVGSQKHTLKLKRHEIANEVMLKYDEQLIKYKKLNSGLPDNENRIKTKRDEYGRATTSEFSKLESEYLEKKKEYNQSFNWWAGIDVYIPVTLSSYKTMIDFYATDISTTKYYPMEGGLTLNLFFDKLKWNTGKFGWLKNTLLWHGATRITFKGSIISNNSVKAKLINVKAVEEYFSRNMSTDTLLLARLKSDEVYVGSFETFWTPSVSARWVYMPYDWIGLSVASEKRFGKINDWDWKFGVPVSLKDREGKAKVNFELIWREVRSERIVGLSVGLPFGNSIF